MSEGNFFAELKRRNVYKVAVAYAVVGWLIAQIATQIFPFLEIPNWIVRLVIVLIAIGFPIALIIAWAFELTPEGIKRTEDAHIPAGRISKKRTWIYVVLVGGALSIGLFFIGRYTARNSGSASPGELPAKSIAVLPFDNLSEDKGNAYFAEGVQDEILTRLAKVADLKVISRTSTQRFKSAPSDLREIAKQLGVMNILEGSVQKANDQVRVNVQLINALTDAHLWADTYDRKLTDIFSVESEIAKTIADTLQAKLTGSEKTSIAKMPTVNSETYELYLKGRFFWNKRSAGDMLKSADYYKQAIAKDPNYALAYAGLAEAYVLFPDYGVGAPGEFYPQAKAAANKALSLDATLAEPHAALGLVYTNYDHDVAKSIAEFERAIQLNPNYATAHQWINTPFQMVGQFDRAMAETKRAIELDPLSLIINSDLAFIYLSAHRFDDALAQSRKTLEMDPGFHVARGYLAAALQFKGQLPEAIAEYRQAAGSSDYTYILGQLGQAYARAGQRDEAQKILARLVEKGRTQYVSGYTVALVYLGLGDKAHAIDALETAFTQHASEIVLIKYDPMLDELRGEPRFEALVQKIVGGK
jgi:TolB-like protein/Tfp pilus assembly protein PilF